MNKIYKWTAALAVMSLSTYCYSDSKKYIFSLKASNDLAACQNFRKVLNSQIYTRPPYCVNRLSLPQKGFKELKKEWLSTDSVNQLFYDVESLLINHPISTYLRQPDGTYKEVEKLPPRFHREEDLSAFQYVNKLSLSNDGVFDAIVMWNTSQRDGNECGTEFGNNSPMISRNIQIPIVINDETGNLDISRTTALISVSNRDGNPSERYKFIPIGFSYEIFDYKDQIYFDTFFDDAESDSIFEKVPSGNREDLLGIFLMKGRSIKEVCEFQLQVKSNIE